MPMLLLVIGVQWPRSTDQSKSRESQDSALITLVEQQAHGLDEPLTSFGCEPANGEINQPTSLLSEPRQ